VFSAAFVGFARILETCFILRRGRQAMTGPTIFGRIWKLYHKLPDFFTGFELATTFLAWILWVPGFELRL
jgi:hypothetical protein